MFPNLTPFFHFLFIRALPMSVNQSMMGPTETCQKPFQLVSLHRHFLLRPWKDFIAFFSLWNICQSPRTATDTGNWQTLDWAWVSLFGRSFISSLQSSFTLIPYRSKEKTIFIIIAWHTFFSIMTHWVLPFSYFSIRACLPIIWLPVHLQIKRTSVSTEKINDGR